nr:hypothetical protein [uncultured Undibacterium sp.]
MSTQEHKHKRITTSTGEILERRYCYLSLEAWAVIDNASRALDQSTSITIHNAVQAAQTKDSQNDKTN